MLSYLPLISLCVGIWCLGNGILHDVFVLMKHHAYDRELLRLLQDGHILMTCGVFQLLAYKGLQNGQPWGYYLAGAACISMLIYCAMIFPFLKSVGTIALNAGLLILLVVSFFKS